MFNRYRAAIALTSLLLTAAAGAHHHRHHGVRNHLDLATVPAGVDLYSRRALRRARIILQLKLLQLREEQLDGIRRALERHVPISTLLSSPTPEPG